MHTKLPVSMWIRQAKRGDAVAGGQLCEHYFEEVVAVGRHFLRNTVKRTCDEHDAANSVFRTFWRRAVNGKFPELCDRDGLWPLLVVITVRKSLKQSRKERLRNPADTPQGFLEGIGSQHSTVELRAAIDDAIDQICRTQGDPLLRDVFILKINGYSVQEIADGIGRSKPTAERKLRLIRKILAEEFLD